MGELTDTAKMIIDITKDGAKSAKAFSKAYHVKSIATKAIDGTAYFPVIISDTLSVDDALLVARSLEKKYASFLLTVMTMNPNLNVDGLDTDDYATSYISQFHQNGNMGDVLNVASTLRGGFNESTEIPMTESELFGIDYASWTTECAEIKAKIFNVISESGLDINDTTFNYTVEEVTNPKTLNEMTGYRKFSAITEAKSGKNNAPVNVNKIDIHNNMPSPTSKGPKVLNPMDHMVNTEFKKANDLVPTMLHIRIIPVKAGGQNPDPFDFIMGVKAVLQSVPSQEVIDNMARVLRNEDPVFKFLRWTTGEIKFFKDFLFCMGEAKSDAVRDNKAGSNGWQGALRRRKNLSKIAKASKTAIMPNATVVVTTDDLDILKEQYGFDLNVPSTKLANMYVQRQFLAMFCRVNAATQRVDILKDNGASTYDTYTFSALSRENTVDDKKFKDMMKMIGRSV